MGYEGTALQPAVAEAVKNQIALRSDFQDDGIIGMIVDMIDNLFGIDLSSFFEVVDGILAPVTAVVNQVIDVFNGLVVTPINNAIAGIIDWFTGNNTDRASALSKANSALSGLTAKANQSDLGNLQSRTQNLEGVIGYCHLWCSGGVSLVAGDRFVPMDNRVGPNPGAGHAFNRIYMGTPGLWVANGQLTFDFLNLGVTYVNLQLVVKNAAGTVWFNRFAEADTDKRVTLNVQMPFTIPGTGYYLEMIANAGSGRGIKGGSAWNGMSVNKLSTETS
jgi:hypothetical protein